MSERKVVCTGNPDREFTLASGFRKFFPDAIFLHRSSGWDLANISEEQKNELQKIFKQCNTFLNCSYIGPDVQTNLLKICHESVVWCDVVNIGSTHEYDNLGTSSYCKSKIALRQLSLTLNSFRFKTSHCIIGGIKTNDPKQTHWLDIDLICQSIIEIWHRPYHCPMMVIDQHKEPW